MPSPQTRSERISVAVPLVEMCIRDSVDAAHGDNGLEQAGEHRGGVQEQRGDVIVDQALQKQRGGDVGDGAERDADQHRHQHALAAQDVADQALEGRAVHVLSLIHIFTPCTVSVTGTCVNTGSGVGAGVAVGTIGSSLGTGCVGVGVGAIGSSLGTGCVGTGVGSSGSAGCS